MAISTQNNPSTPASAVYLNGNIYTVDEQNPVASAMAIADDRFIAAWVNSKALEIAGITNETANPPGGEIINDADGIPTGVLVDTAKLLVSEKIPPFTEQKALKALEMAQQEFLSNGVTSGHDAGCDLETIERTKALFESGRPWTYLKR